VLSSVSNPDKDTAALENTDDFVAEIQRFVTQSHRVLLELQNDPDETAIDEALKKMAKIRDRIELAGLFLRDARELRDKFVAHVADAAPTLTMETIAGLAGVGDSYASRVARAHGAARRAKKWEDFRLALADGLTVQQAATRLGLSGSTIRRYNEKLAAEQIATGGSTARR
jgi:hypothetical protein